MRPASAIGRKAAIGQLRCGEEAGRGQAPLPGLFEDSQSLTSAGFTDAEYLTLAAAGCQPGRSRLCADGHGSGARQRRLAAVSDRMASRARQRSGGRSRRWRCSQAAPDRKDIPKMAAVQAASPQRLVAVGFDAG